MKISFLPKSPLGKWTVGLNIFFLIAFIFLYIFAELLNLIPFEIVRIIGATSVIVSIIAFFTGVIAVIKIKERSALVFLSIIIGLVVLSFVIVSIIEDMLFYLEG